MSTVILECKKLCLYRCLSGMVLSVSMQFVLLAVFLLFVNVDLLHPINWMYEILRQLFAFYTWLYITPLVWAVIIYGILLGKSHLAVKQYYASRFQLCVRTFLRKFSSFAIHIAVGFLTTWLYSHYMHVDYSYFMYKCYSVDCLNLYYIFVMGAGISAACYHFFKENLYQEPKVEYPILQEKKLVKMRSLLYFTLYNSFLKSFVPTLCYALAYCLFGGFVNLRLCRLFRTEMEESYTSFFALITNLRLLFYAWILFAHILSNMNLMQNFFEIFLSEEIQFAIEKNPLANEDEKEITLVEALSMNQVPVIQNLAALNLYTIASSHLSSKRQEIFSLTVPGGHPNNWNQLSAQCLSMINAFIEELTASVKNISNIKSSPLFCQTEKPTATEAAEKILLRQYNTMNGIRRLNIDPPPSNVETPVPPRSALHPSNVAQRINAQYEYLSKRLEQSLTTAFNTIPGLSYMFGEADGAKTAFLLSNSQMIVWIIQGLAAISAASIHEDKFGVVQTTLPQIIKTFLNLDAELEKLNNVNLNGKKLDRNLITLKNAVRRSLHQISAAFGDYLLDIFDDKLEAHTVQSLKSFQGI